MKRPAGPAARPGRPTPPRAPERPAQPVGGSGRGADDQSGRSGSGGRAEADAPTEPIELPKSARKAASTSTSTAEPTSTATATAGPTGTPGGLAARLTLPGRGAKPVADTPTGSGSGATTSEPDAPAAEHTPTTAAADTPLTARAARGRLRAARRARKQYERNEVRRFTSRSRHRRNLWLAAAGTVIALVAFVLVGVFSPLMALRTIEITGTSRIPAADVAQALDGQLGTPLPLLDLAEVKAQLSEFSLIRSYVTESRPPDTLVVRIVEREPVGAIVSAAGFDLVDAAGVVIQGGPDRPEGYPLIDTAGGASGTGFQAGVAVVGALPEGIRAQLDTVTAATKDDVALTLAGGARVVWGNAERSEYKALVLAALIVSHPVGSVTEYDVSSPDSAVVR